MYGREYGDRELRFEASGGLIHASLVMQDKETDSYWSIMDGTALAGDFKGTRLRELPLGTKTQWKNWVAAHPDTLVLSVDGTEHIERNPYEDYFADDKSFRGTSAADDRLPTKASIYAFQRHGDAYAAPFSAIEDGAVFDLGDEQVFLYRPQGVAIFYSTLAFVAPKPGFEQRDGAWHHAASDSRFDPAAATFAGAGLDALDGFDTFWFNWSMNHPKTEVLASSGP